MLLRLGRGMSGVKGASTAPAAGYLDTVLASAVFDVDATVAESYGGSGANWANLIASPADGAAQSAYDFTSHGFSFTGTPGDSGAYWLSDGDDYMQIAGGNTAFLNALHKTVGGTDWWVCIARNQKTQSTTQTIMNTQYSASAAGLRVGTYSENVNTGFYAQRGDSGQSTANLEDNDNNTDRLLILSWDSAGNILREWNNSAAAYEYALTPNVTGGDATHDLQFGVQRAAQYLATGTRLYHIAMGNEFLDDVKAAAIISHLQDRHGRIYNL